MGLNATPSSGRVHIAFFGRRNVGKSRLVNAVTGQDIALVSDVKGTTTDPVHKAMELLPLGPVVIIDTPGIDDEGPLGEMRVRRARRVLNKADVAVLVAEASAPLGRAERELVGIFREKDIPFVVALNKSDLSSLRVAGEEPASALSLPETLLVSAKTGFNVNVLKDRIAALVRSDGTGRRLVADLVRPLDTVLLVVPIDKAAPKGRLILPQQQTIRDLLEAGAIAVVARDSELRETLAKLSGADGKGKGRPALVITDSQAFAKVSALVPRDIPLTSFSILFARYKGSLESSLRGVAMLEGLRDGDKVLICEGCTHHRQCDDIGTVKLPRMIRAFTGNEPEFSFCSGGDFPDDLSGYGYKMVIHCGGCMLNDREMQYRRLSAEDQNVPFTNYGITIAKTQGILARSVAVFS
ncbi:MAG: [FeFe] hydrogenase H-cluster maturation GTPase HydF [Treponema sp.]|nr:[FeFe] hydrogenase H-cluster maturation GTPase HydF [Treponema sp.]